MNNQDDTERIISNINRKALEERLGIKPESSIDYNRGRINTTPKSHEIKQPNIRTFKSSGKKAVSSKKNEAKFLKVFGYAILLAALTLGVLACHTEKEADHADLSPYGIIYWNDEPTNQNKINTAGKH